MADYSGQRMVTASLTAQNQFTKGDGDTTTQAATGTAGLVAPNYFNFSISGTWVGTITFQRSFDNGVTWHDMPITFTANEEGCHRDPESFVKYRCGFKTGDYTSGTAVIRISQ